MRKLSPSTGFVRQNSFVSRALRRVSTESLSQALYLSDD
jgi:hypothetical protein